MTPGIRVTVAALLAAVVSGSCAPRQSPVPATAPPAAADRLLPLDDAARRWVDSTLASLDTRGRAAQLVMPWTGGRYAPVGSADADRLRAWVDAGVGGVIISIGAPVTVADKLNRLQRQAAVPLLVAADLEHGPSQRLAGGVLLPWGTELGGGTEVPPVMALAAGGDPSLAYELGRVTAVEARAVGIHLNFAPVADVNNNPDNPIINTRSYGEDPALVARFVAAHVRGLQDHGMLATAKHFPGHGDTSDDSHIAPLILRIDAARADAVELVPFRAAIDAGVAAVMTAHIAFPALTGDSVLPATLSPRMIDSLLVRAMGFEGLVVTDALDMGAIVAAFGRGEAAVLALEAGADLLLQPPDPFVVIDAIVDAVETGRIAQARIDRSVRKLLEAKARVGLHRRRTVDVEAVAQRVGVPAHAELGARIAEAAITLVRDRDGLVPLAPDHRAGRVLSIVYTDDVAPFAGRRLNATLAPRLPGLETIHLGAGQHPAALADLSARADGADLVVFIADVRVRSGKGTVAIEEPVAAMVRDIAARRPVIAVSLGSPYLLHQFPEVGTYLLGWGRDAPSQVAAGRAILGERRIGGRLPISIPPLHGRGEGVAREIGSGAAASRRMGEPASASFVSLDTLIAGGIARRVAPGAVVVVGAREGVRFARAYGTVDWAPDAAAATDSTLYDLASLTKVLGTRAAVLRLVEDGRMALDDPLADHLPLWPRAGWRSGVTIRRLLEHQAGLAPFIRFWHPSGGALRGRDAILTAIAALPAEYQPGERRVYSDLGYILLGAAVEAVSGQSLDRFLAAEVFGPLGMDDTGFNPRAWATLDRIAPTEIDTVLRHAHVHGEVHDENAWAMGGVAGHAGLFSTAGDVARFAHRLLRDAAADATGSTAVPAGDRLGWVRAEHGARVAEPFSARAFGHTGFTGTSVWIDPELDLFVVLLTNRVNPTRDGAGIVELRRAVHQAAAAGRHPALEDRHLPRTEPDRYQTPP